MQPINTSTFPAIAPLGGGMLLGGENSGTLTKWIGDKPSTPTLSTTLNTPADIAPIGGGLVERGGKGAGTPRTGVAPGVALNPGQEFIWDNTGRYTGIKESNPGMKYVETPNTPPLKTTLPSPVVNNTPVVPQVAASSFGWQNNVVPTTAPTNNLFNLENANTLLSRNTPSNSPYTYGNLDLTSSDYSIWGSKGNPYYVAGPTYTPGSGMPIVPAPIPFVPPVNNGGGDSSPIPDWTDPNSPEAQAKNYADLQSWLGRDRDITRGVTGAFGLPLLDPAVDFMYGINPFTQQSLSWYDGSTDDFNYVGTDESLQGKDYSAAVEAYMQDFMNDMTDLDQDEYVENYMRERGWGAQTFADPNDPLAVEAQQLQDAAQEQIASNIRAEAAAKEAEAKAKAQEQQRSMDLMYNKFTGYTDKQLAGVTNSINKDIANVTAQINANQGNTQEQLNELNSLQNELYDLTNSQVDSLSAQITNMGVTTQAQYDALDAQSQQRYNDLHNQLELVEGNLAEQVGGWTDNDFNNWTGNNQDFGISETDLGGVPTTVQDAYDEEKYYQETGEYDNVAPPAPSSPVVYGHPEVVAPITDSSSSDSGGDTWTDDTGSTWSTEDYSSQEEYDDDWSFDDDGWDEASSDSGGGDSGGGGGGGSYIATAATQALGEEGLQVFNNWRDYMSGWHPTFKTSYGRYRVTAPKIVAEIDKKDNSKELYKEIWDKHLKPIFDLIKEDKDNPKALSDYKIMVKELMNKYLK